MLAPRAHDVAFTSLMLAEPPVFVPWPLRPPLRWAGRLLARRFIQRYESNARVTVRPDELAWHRGVVCLRALTEVAGWVVGGTTAEHAGHPWLVTGPALAARLSAVTGVQVRSNL